MVSLPSIRQAADRLQGVAHRTQVLTSTTLDDLLGAKLFLKAECFQRAGAFKFRGAYNALASLTDHERSKGVVAASSGNHAQAVALAAKLLNIDAVVVMPSDAPALKRRATLGYGARIVEFNRYADDRESIQRKIAEQEGRVIVPAYDDYRVMSGQGTTALELLEQVENLDAFVAPMSGGGLMAGCATAIKELSPGTKIYGAEPETANDTAQSLAAGERVLIDMPATIADGLMARTPGELTFPIVQRLVDDVLVASDAEVASTMRFLLERQKIVVEPSGAVALAALIRSRNRLKGQRVGIVLSGGNVDREGLVQILSPGTDGEAFLS